MQRRLTPYPLIAFIAALIMAACASIGTPDGGEYDEEPPKVVKCLPTNMATNNKNKKLRILFDEYIVLENASEKVVISPPQNESPDIRTSGKKIIINMRDSLKENTTYTIDFADAIVDNNEGNPMGNFTYSFSTGPDIDTLEVSGTLLQAEDLEPVKGMLIGLHTDLADSAFTSKPFARVSRTDSRGKFNIKGVAPGKYRIYGLQDMDANFYFSQKAEVLAFDTTLVIPSCAPDVRMDTVWADSTHIDSIFPVHYTHFYPDNLVLRCFTEDNQDLHLLKLERKEPSMFTVYFTSPADTLPILKGLNFDESQGIIVEPTATNDTINYWLSDTLVAYMDTLVFSLTYMETDTAGLLAPHTDTLELTPKITRARQLKELQQKIEDWEKEQKKTKRKRSKEGNKPEKEPVNPFLRETLNYRMQPGGEITPLQNIKITFAEPVGKLDTAMFRFYKQKDTLWLDEPYLLLPVENDVRSYMLYAEWYPGERYKLEADSDAVVSVLGKLSMPIKKEIGVMSEDELGALFVHLVMPDTGGVVQLMDKKDKVVRTVRAVNNRADFFYLKPDEYYLRAFIDKNGDDVWTTGEYATMNQPEEVFYFPKPMVVRAKWEVEQDWEVRAIPLNKQKPQEITKQKPDAEKQIKQRNAERKKNK